MHKFRISEKLEDILLKLRKRDLSIYKQLRKKIDEIVNCYDVEHYKNLRYNMKDSKRAHVRHFVLIFQYDKKTDIISFDDFEHHDIAYKR